MVEPFPDMFGIWVCVFGLSMPASANAFSFHGEARVISAVRHPSPGSLDATLGDPSLSRRVSTRRPFEDLFGQTRWHWL